MFVLWSYAGEHLTHCLVAEDVEELLRKIEAASHAQSLKAVVEALEDWDGQSVYAQPSFILSYVENQSGPVGEWLFGLQAHLNAKGYKPRQPSHLHVVK
jgi:hypothetical protein